MPKPVLSDSLFNADDVATAVLAEANLSVTNQDFAVHDRSSEFTIDSYWDNVYYSNFYSFNGFMFVNFYIGKMGATPSSGQVIYTISTDFRPNDSYIMPTISYQGDSAEIIHLNTNGNITVSNPNNVGSSNYYVAVNGWYRFT